MRGLSLVLLGAAQACFLRLEKPLKDVNESYQKSNRGSDS